MMLEQCPKCGSPLWPDMNGVSFPCGRCATGQEIPLSQRLAERSFIDLWQGYCTEKEKRQAAEARLAEAEALRKDAERYRYLRDATGWSIQQWLGLTGVWTEYLSGKSLDITIDAAMEASHE